MVWKTKYTFQAKNFSKPTVKKIYSSFFARWDTENTKFLYLGTGNIIRFEDNVQTKQGFAIKLMISCSEANEIINQSIPNLSKSIKTESSTIEKHSESSSSFLLESHLEGYLEKYWGDTIFGKDYDIFENGRQYPTETGPLDILAQKKDKTEFMVLELKRDKTSDVAVAQTLRYMGYIKKTLSLNNEIVRGTIIGTREDKNLVHALSMVDNIDFYRYNLTFSLNRIEF